MPRARLRDREAESCSLSRLVEDRSNGAGCEAGMRTRRISVLLLLVVRSVAAAMCRVFSGSSRLRTAVPAASRHILAPKRKARRQSGDSRECRSAGHQRPIPARHSIASRLLESGTAGKGEGCRPPKHNRHGASPILGRERAGRQDDLAHRHECICRRRERHKAVPVQSC